MQDYIIEANIERFRELLRHECDEAQRAMVSHLLAEERAKLAALIASPDGGLAPRHA